MKSSTSISIILVAFLIMSGRTQHALGQQIICLEKIKKPEKRINLESDVSYIFKTSDTTIVSRIENFSDSTLSVVIWNRSISDSKIKYINHYGTEIDTVYYSRYPVYTSDTLTYPFSEIRRIKAYWFNNTMWLEPFGWLALMAVIAIPLLPVAIIQDGVGVFSDWLAIEGYLVGISAPALFIGTRKTIYNTEEKWTIQTRDTL